MTLLKTLLRSAGMMLVLLASQAEAASTLSGRNWCKSGNTDTLLVGNDTIAVKWEAGRLRIIRDDGKEVFVSNGPSATNNLCFQGDGNLVIYNSVGSPIWYTGTHGTSASILQVNGPAFEVSDGTQALWSYQEEGGHDTRVGTGWCRDRSQPGTIVSNERLSLEWTHFPDGRGWLTARNNRDGAQLWGAGHNGFAEKVCFQVDGNLVVYDASGWPLFASNTDGTGANTLKVDSGGIAISNGTTDYFRTATQITNTTSLSNGWVRTANAVGIVLKTGDAHLMWKDGALKLYDSQRTLKWESTSGGTGAWLTHQGDGNLVIYNASGSPVWATGTNLSNYAGTLTLDSCTLQLLNASGTVKWSQGGTWCGNTVSGGGFSYIEDQSFGNSKFGAGLWVVAAAMDDDSISGIRSTADSESRLKSALGSLYSGSVSSNFAKLLGNAGADITLFGSTKTLIEGDAYVTNEGGTQSNYAGLEVLGQVVFSKSAQATLDYVPVEQEFFSISTTFTVLAIPITVEASATGSLGLTGSLTPGSSGATIVAEPFANITGNASAGVGTTGFSAGIEGELTLINVAVPLTVNLNLTTKSYSTQASLELSSLDGSVSLYAKGFGQKATKKLGSWDGLSYTKSLLSRSSSL
jgi:hypothetical protein